MNKPKLPGSAISIFLRNFEGASERITFEQTWSWPITLIPAYLFGVPGLNPFNGYFAGGGGGGNYPSGAPAPGGLGGGGGPNNNPQTPTDTQPIPGTDGTGGGGAGGSLNNSGGTGGKGIVIIRYISS